MNPLPQTPNMITAYVRYIDEFPELQIVADDPQDETYVRGIIEQSPLANAVERYQREAMSFRVKFRKGVDEDELYQVADVLMRNSGMPAAPEPL